MALREMRRFDEAITDHTEAAVRFRETGDPHGEAAALADRGTTQMSAGYLNDAITDLTEAATIFRDTGDHHSEGQTLRNLGIAWKESGDLHKARYL